MVWPGRELPPALLQTVSSSPYLGGSRGAAALCLLNVLHRDIHPLLGQRWATTIALLLEYLEGEPPEVGPLHPTMHVRAALTCEDQGSLIGKKSPPLRFREGLDSRPRCSCWCHVGAPGCGALGFLCALEGGAGPGERYWVGVLGGT